MDRDVRRSNDSGALGNGPGGIPSNAVGVLWHPDSGTPIGTCFAYGCPGCFLTAAHVIRGKSASDLEILIGAAHYKVGRATSHPTEDVAAVQLRPGFSDFGRFRLAEAPDGLFPLAKTVATYGYALNTKERRPEARWMFGHVQCHINGAYELSCPSFPGNSGSPVMPDNDCGSVLGLTFQSRNISYKLLSAEDEENGGNPPVVVASFAMAVALNPIADWLAEVCI